MKIYDVQAEFQGSYPDARQSTKYIAVHHAAGLYPTKNGLDDVRAIKKFHTDPAPKGRGWPGIAYHIVLAEETEGGPIARYNCSKLDTLRYHIAYRNHLAVGICCATNFNDKKKFPNKRPTQKWLDAIREVVLDLRTNHYPLAAVVGHKDIAVEGFTTSCPGDTWASWRGAVIEDVQQLTMVASPRMQKAAWTKALERSPSSFVSDELWDIVRNSGIDPAVALAFFEYESKYGTEGVCFNYTLKNWGNVRTPHDRSLALASVNLGSRGEFARYPTWQNGLIDWCKRIIEKYGQQLRLHTVEQVIPIYAPSSDGNNENAYIVAVRRNVAAYAALSEPQIVIEGVPVAVEFEEAFILSGAVWRDRGILTPGKPIAVARFSEGTLIQEFERAVAKLSQDGFVDWALRAEDFTE